VVGVARKQKDVKAQHLSSIRDDCNDVELRLEESLAYIGE
jgi:hypothetical protein